MTWQDLLNAQRVRVHRTGPEEIYNLRAVVDRDLRDAKLGGLFGLGHHQTTFQALGIAMGPSISALSAYFDLCRRQRNQVDYDMANVATEAEANLLVQKAEEFQRLVEDWMRMNHPDWAV